MMKSKALCAVIGMSFLLGCSQNSPVNSVPKVQIDGLERSMYSIESVSERYHVYRCDGISERSNSRLARYAALFGVSGPTSEKGETLSISGSSGSAVLNKRTGVLQITSRNETGSDVADEVTDAKVAENFLKSLGFEGEELMLHEVSTRMVASYNLATKTAVPETIEQRDFTFRRLFNGTTAYGPGSKVVISVGKDSKIVGGIIDLPDVTSTRSVKLKEVPKAMRELDPALTRINTTIRERRQRMIRLTTNSLKVRFIAQPTPDGGLEFKPSYAVLGNATRQDGSEHKNIAVFVTASDEAPLSDTPPMTQEPLAIPGTNPQL